MSRRSGPPSVLEAVLERIVGDGPWGRGVVGDLSEAYHRRRRTRGSLRCDAWYALQILSMGLHRVSGAASPGADRGGAGAADLRYALRVVARRPLTALAVVATLALGLGANAAVFRVIDGTFRASDWWADGEHTLLLQPGRTFSRGQLAIFETDAPAFRAVGLYRLEPFTAAVAGGAPGSVPGARITPRLFRELEARPVLGRAFADEESRPGGEPVVIVSYGFWQRELGGDPTAVGRRIDVNGEPHTVVGVQARGGTAPGNGTDLWLPVPMDPGDPDYFPDVTYTLVGVLASGRTADDGRATLQAFGRRLAGMFPSFYRPDYLQDATVEAARTRQRTLLGTPLYLLMGGTILLLIIAALNVGTMLMTRAVERRRELAVRRALGAGRTRIVRQLATESALLAAVGTGLGLAVAGPLSGALVRLFPAELAVVRSGWAAPSVALFVTTAALLAWLVLTGVPVAAFLAGARRGVDAGIRPSGSAPRGLLVVQSALATVLLAAAVLLVQSVINLRGVPLGFDPEGVTAVEVAPPADFMRERARLREFQEGVVVRAAALPGVSAAGMTSVLPLDGPPPDTPVNPRGAEVEVAVAARAERLAVDAGFFETLGVRLEAGRLFGSTDRGDDPTAVVVNRTLADRLWPGQDPVGRAIAIDPHAWETFVPVVGVVSDVRADGLVGPARPMVFVSLYEQPERRTALVVRSEGAAAALAPGLRRVVADADPAVAAGSVRSLARVVRDAYGTAWVTMGLLAALAALATALAAVGIHTSLANHVVRHRRDIGVRLALGADRGRVVGGVMASGLGATLLGVAAGCLAAAAATRMLRSLLFGVDALEPTAYLLPAAGVVLAAGLAALRPALQAGRTAPAEALRED
ncbi:MAG: ABC transporter permease [Longimicrobiales bacterium]